MAVNLQFAGINVEQFLEATHKGIQQNMGDTETMMIEGHALAKPAVLLLIESKLQLYGDVRTARQVVDDKVNVREAGEADAQKLAASIDAGIGATWGADPIVKAKYGVPMPAAPRQLTAAEKFKRTQKAKATRIMRGTMGKRQKAGVKAKGDVTVTATLNPPSASSSPAGIGSGTGAANGSVNGATNGAAANGVATNGAAH